MSSSKRKRDDPARSTTMSAFAALQRLRSTPAPSPADVAPSIPEPVQETIPTKRQAKKPKSNEPKPLPLSIKASEPSSVDQNLEGDETGGIKVFSSSVATKSRHGSTVLVSMKKGERLVILGSYGLAVRGEGGRVTVSGASLNSSAKKAVTHWIHAPHSHAVPVIRCRRDARMEILSHPSAVSLRQLSSLNPVFRRLWDEGCKKGIHNAKQTFHIIETSEDVPTRTFLQELISPPEWNQKLKTLEERVKKGPTVVLVCGPKSSGKSTFAKLLCNKWLSSQDVQGQKADVAVLDIDPGQPEYSPAGLISLVHVRVHNLGASFTHPVPTVPGDIIVHSHAIASSSPAASPEFYISCILDLFSRYRAKLSHLPLIINTAGWIQGTGLDIVATIISKISPSEVIYMSTDGPVDTVEALECSSETGKCIFSQLPSQACEYTSRTAAHLRTMQTMSYFHSGPPTHPFKDAPDSRQYMPPLDWDTTPLVARRPTVVRYSGKGGVSAIYSYHHQSHPDDLADSILGRIVAIVELESSSHLPNITQTAEGLPYIISDVPLDPSSSNTLGLALIRGIDQSTKTMEIISPVPLAKVSASVKAGRRLVFVSGSFDLPTWLYVEDKHLQAVSANEEGDDKSEEMEVITDEDTSEDSSEAECDDVVPGTGGKEDDIPWVEILKGNQKRGVGAKVWRVRRDLGRRGPTG